MKFELDNGQFKKANIWLDEQYKKEYKRRQKEKLLSDHDMIIDEKYYPYHGAIGGGVEYVFIPTSLGVITLVRYNGEELNLTDFENW